MTESVVSSASIVLTLHPYNGSGTDTTDRGSYAGRLAAELSLATLDFPAEIPVDQARRAKILQEQAHGAAVNMSQSYRRNSVEETSLEVRPTAAWPVSLWARLLSSDVREHIFGKMLEFWAHGAQRLPRHPVTSCYLQPAGPAGAEGCGAGAARHAAVQDQGMLPLLQTVARVSLSTMLIGQRTSGAHT